MQRKFFLHPKPSRLWIFCSLLKRFLKLLFYITCAVAIMHFFQNTLKLTSFGLLPLTDMEACRKQLAGKKPVFRISQNHVRSNMAAPNLVRFHKMVAPSSARKKQLQEGWVMTQEYASPLRDNSDWYPFLTSRDIFWKDDPSMPRKVKEVLRRHQLPFGLNGSGSEAFKAVQLLPQQEMPESISRLRCMSCAVVGNPQELRGRRLGKLIDSHDVVIRLTSTPQKEYKEDMGEKTTIRFFRPELLLSDPLETHNSDAHFFLVPYYMVDFIWLKSVLQKNKTNRIWLNGPLAWNGSAARLRILNPYVNYKVTYEHLRLPTKPKKYATTGIIALNFALNVCHQVSVAGLGFQELYNSNTPLGHYGVDVMPMQYSKHNFTAEMMWLLKMRKKAFISDMLCPRPWSWFPWLC